MKGQPEGYTKDKNRALNLTGVFSSIDTFYGKFYTGSGVIRAYHYGSKILEVNLNRKCLSTFGMGNYSQSTGQNVMGWLWNIARAFPIDAKFTARNGDTFTASSNRVRWTCFDHSEPTMFDLFRSNLPCVTYDGSAWWYHWEFDDDTLLDTYYKCTQDLATKQNWRWFTYRWIDGVWTRAFIDDAAVKRWKAKQKRTRKAT